MKVNSYIMSTTGKDNPEFADLYIFHGKSAYQAAVEQGFEGTEEEWLASLCELRFGTVGTFSDKLDTLLYVDTELDQIFRYDVTNSVYKAIGAPLGETEKTAYRGDRGKIAYDHSQSDHDYLHRNGGIMLGIIQSMNIVPKTTNIYTLGSTSSIYLAAHIKELNGHTIKLSDGTISTEILHSGDINTYLGSSEYRRGRYFYTSEKTILTAFDVYGSATDTWDYWAIRDGSNDLFRFNKNGTIDIRNTDRRNIILGKDVLFLDNVYEGDSASARGIVWKTDTDGTGLIRGSFGRLSNFSDSTKDYFYFGTDYVDSWLNITANELNTRSLLPQSNITYSIGSESLMYSQIFAKTFIGALSGNASSATKLATSRLLTIGLTGKSFDGTAPVSWTLAEIGAFAITGGTLTGDIVTQDINPTTDNTYVLGGSSLRYKGVYATTFYGVLSGNATSASKAEKLTTAININGTSFDGSADIITNRWGLERNISISDADGTNTGTAVAVNGSTSYILPLPATIKAALSGNATTATTLQTARTIAISGKATGTATSFNGSKNISIPITAIDPSGVTQSASYRFVTDTQISEWNDKPTQKELNDALAALVDSSPELLNTLDELAAALGDDPNFATTMTNALATKLPLAGGTMTGDIKSLNIIPVTTDTNTLGSSSYVYKGVYATTFYGALSGNATSATKLKNARNFNISDYSGTNAGATASFNGTTAVTLKLPDTIKATSFVGDLSGNATTSSSTAKLTSAVNINGTAFDGSKAITTATWGTARNVSIADASSTNTGTAVSVDGSGAVTLLLPATIKATLSGNASSATKLATARNFNISDYSGTNAGAAVSFNGTAAITLKLPDTIKATSFVGDLSGNASTATKLATARTITLSGSVTGSASFDGSGNITISTSTNHTHSYLPLSGGTLTGALSGTTATFSGAVSVGGRITASGKISLPSTGNSWINGMTTTNASINISTQNSESSYHPIIAGTSYGGNIWNIGTIKENIGFYGFLKGRTENATDWKATWDITTGNMTNTGSITAASFSGSGASLTSLNASNISSGTLAAARLATSGATAGSYGPSANASPAHGGTFTVPYVTVDKYGRVTSISTKTITLPADNNTDTKVTQSTSTTTSFRALLMGTSYNSDPTALETAETGQAYKATGIYAQPSTASLYATTFVGALSGNASSASKLATARKLTIGATGKNFDGSAAVSWTLAEIGAAAASHTHNYAGSSSAGGAATTALACTGNAATATKLATARTISLTGSVTGSVSFDGSGNVSITTTTNHTHSYLALSGGTLTGTLTSRAITPSADNTYALGTSTAKWSNVYATTFTGALSGNASSASKLATARKLTIGATGKNFDGSAAVSWTLAEIGAAAASHSHDYAASSHTHSYAGSSSAGGSATSAVKLATARTLTIGSKGKTFDGSAAVSWTLAEIGAAAASHTHKYAGSSSAGGAATSLSYFKNTSTTVVSLTDATANCIAYTNDTSAILGQSDGALYKQVYSANWIHEIYGDYRTGQIAVRGMNNGTWQAWRAILDSSNFASHITPASIGAAATSHSHSGYAASSHTHKYAGSSSAGGSATSAVKLATSRTLTIGSKGKTFDGSANVSWTLAEIGAAAASHSHTGYAASSHTHSYAGSSSAGGAATTALACTGNSATATKLATARTLTIGSKGKTFDGSANVSWTLAEIGAAAASHTHSTITGAYTSNGGQQKPNYFGVNKVGALMMNTTVNGNSQYKDWLFMDCYAGNDVGGAVAIGVNRQSLGLYIMRSAAERTSWAESAEVLHTGNWSSYCAAKSHTHSAYAASSHTHNYAGSSSAGGDANNALKLGGYSASSSATASTIALRNSSGYLYATYLNQSSGAETPTTSSYIMYANSDGFLRKSSLANIKSILGLGSAAYTASTAYATASHTHSYLPLSGGTVSGHTVFAGGTYQSDASIRWGYGAIQIRENGLVGTAQSADAYAPTLGFHWSGIIAGQLILGSDGSFKFKNQSDTGAPIQTGLIYSDKGFFDRVIYFTTFTELAASLNAKITTHGETFGTYYPIYIGPAGTTAVDLGSMTSSSALNSTINQKGAILDFRFCRRLYSTAAGNTSLINGCRLSILNLRLTHTDSSDITVNSKTLISLAITMNMSLGLYTNAYLEVSNCDIIYNYKTSSASISYTKTIKIEGPSKMTNNVINMNSSQTSFSPYAYVVEISSGFAHIISNNTILAYVQSSDASAIASLNVRDASGSSRRVIIISGNIFGSVFLGKLNSGGVYKCSGNYAVSITGNGNPGTGF